MVSCCSVVYEHDTDGWGVDLGGLAMTRCDYSRFSRTKTHTFTTQPRHAALAYDRPHFSTSLEIFGAMQSVCEHVQTGYRNISASLARFAVDPGMC